MVENLILAAPLAGLLALGFAFMKASWVSGQDAGTDEMKEIAGRIQEGAMAFLGREYKVLAIFVVIVAALLAFANMSGEARSPLIALSFVIGAVASGLAGYAGMKVATNANVRTTAAARTGLPKALDVAFAGGSVMGMTVVGLALIGLGGLFFVYRGMFELGTALNVITGFSMGASSIALFARVGGGIFCRRFTDLTTTITR